MSTFVYRLPMATHLEIPLAVGWNAISVPSIAVKVHKRNSVCGEPNLSE